MYVCDELTYIQMPKTGCTHIESLLSRLFNGQTIGKHNAAPPEQIAATKYFVSSIRNPWEWYVSLWAYGVQGEGGLVSRLVERQPGRLIRAMLRNPSRVPELIPALIDEFGKDVEAWRKVYRNGDRIDLFRSWLKRVHDPDSGRHLVKHRDTVITRRWGFMSYRYLSLCCGNFEQLSASDRHVGTYEALAGFDAENCYIDFFVRQEILEASLCEAIEKFRPLTEEEKVLIFGADKTNTSRRSRSVAAYYDQESIDIVARRDRLIVDKFGYQPPC